MKPLKPQLWGIGFGLSCLIANFAPVLAVQPAPINANDNVAWSRVVQNPFDGQIVYDRNYTRDFALVTSWSKNGIRATYARINTTLVGYEPYLRPGIYGYGGFYGAPIYQRTAINSVPSSIQFVINGKSYLYEEGPVSSELAAALASAPPGKMLIRLVWKDGVTRDVEIGADTVQAWKTIYR